MKLTNGWNRLIYRLWAPVYDVVFDRLLFAPARRQVWPMLNLQSAERALLIGIGTGADLPFLPDGLSLVRVDLSPEMLARARARLGDLNLTVLLVQADAQHLPLPGRMFDAAALNLILSVVPDARRCWQETVRTLRAGGRILIFDKFLPDNISPNLARRLLNHGTVLLGTDINRRLGDIIDRQRIQIVRDEPSLLGGAYRIILIRTPKSED